MVTIRLAEARDTSAIAAIYAPFCSSTAVSFEEHPPAPAEMAARIARITEQHPWLVLQDEDVIAGYAYASPHRDRAAYRWSADVTVYIHEDYRHRGTGRALYTALLRMLQRQGYFRAYAGVALPNPASEGFHLAMGFTEVGVYQAVGYKLGAWRDVRWYSKDLLPLHANPPEPLPVSALLGTPAWEEAVAAGLPHFRAAQRQPAKEGILRRRLVRSSAFRRCCVSQTV